MSEAGAAARPAAPNVSLNVSSMPENVVLVRQMLAGLAEAVGVDANDLNDITTAVTEACNNVVLHAYAHQPGPLQVDVSTLPAGIEVVVRDLGRGIEPPIAKTASIDEIGAGGLGLSVITALCQSSQFRGGMDGGTEVLMSFAAPKTRVPPAAADVRYEPVPIAEPPSGAIEIAIAPAGLARTILPRLLSVAAARAHFTTDRLADAQLLSDTLTDRLARSISGGCLRVLIGVQPRELKLALAPLLAGQADQLVADAALDGLGGVLERLAGDHEVAGAGEGDDEMLALRLLDSPPRRG